MGREIAISNLGFFSGILGIIIASIPFLDGVNDHWYNSVLPILFGILGLYLTYFIRKEINDDIVKAGWVVNPISILLGIVQFFV